MGATFVVTLREAFEAALLLGIIYGYLDKIGARRHWNYVTTGGILGLVASVVMGMAVVFASGALLDLGPDLVTLAVVFLAVVLLTWHGWWMRSHAREVAGHVQRRIDQAEATKRLWLVGLIAFTGVFREGAETVLFLWGLMSQVNVSGLGGLAGGVLGVGTAAALGWAIFHGGRRLSLQRFFNATSVLLMLVAAGLCSTGFGKLQALGMLPSGDPLWDGSWLLSDDSVVGRFLGGLVGYRARPTLFEVGAYSLYLVAATVLLFGHRGPNRSAHEARHEARRAGRVPGS